MGTKRNRKGGELPTCSNSAPSLSYAATERPPPTKVPRTATATAPPSSARRFGFKGPSISQLPTLAMKRGEMLMDSRVSLDTVERAAPVELDVHVLEMFSGIFSQEMIATLDQLLAFKYKTNKFAVKARKEEQINYIKELKTVVRDVVAKIQAFNKVCTVMDDKLAAEKATLERRFAHEILQKNVARILASEQEVTRSNAVLKDNAAKLEIQLEEAQKSNAQLKLDLKAHKARMADESRRFEEKKHELEISFEKKGHDEDERKQAELEELQNQLSKARDELTSVQKDLEKYENKVIEATNSLSDERERRTRANMEKCTLEAKNQALESRVNSAENEVVELKEKFQQKDGEVSNLVKSLTEIQKFNASASAKAEADKKELADKVERLQTTIHNLERQESSSSTTVRDLRKQLEVCNTMLCLEIKSRKEAEQSEQEVRIQMKQVEGELQENLQKVGVEGGVRQMLEDQVRELRTEHIAVNAQMEAVKAEMKRLQSAGVDSKEQHNKQMDTLEQKFQQERDSFRSLIDKLQEEKVCLESEVQTLRTRASTVRIGDVEELCKVKRDADILRRRLTELTNQGAQSIAQKDSLILELQEKVKLGDMTRRAMHNTIQELRGNVRVFARTRPFLPSDHCDPNTTTPIILCDFDGESLKLRRPGKNPSEPDTFAFTFDKVFAPSAGQDAVFEQVSEFVQSSLDGYHVCLFSYGQTGSGKTHTARTGNGQMRGIIPRAIEMILQECEALKEQGWKYVAKVSFLEIYNESLKDLLTTKHSSNDKLGIKKNARGGVYVPGLTMVDVNAIDQVEVLMEQASRARSVACTDMNVQSSRSHSVFTLHLQGVNDKDGVMLNGQLNLVDLAGSERASRSNVSGDRLKETQAINKSLSCLADVFNAIGSKASHIPFRNSKLTYLLQSSLSGDGKTLMMVNLSPTLESASESLCSLRFAKQVNQCELGKPKRQIKSRKDRP
ncbi:kinesin-like protein [Phytophthora infestans T30-4]|uniref:Kinesin-like protein n=1 Tax=Phytophthora infestans (strain T30-4) TaxID=403677 RepID=D0NZ93_PHYIT|nr:kinesin-like protein [Phytophthora infestans T30-4]EEY68890.1 kinesin-like protein [Phytophthora infestans T30-4]|eukprot:XP_002997318.1 kinesin-like protein [Phytophthora infestans T30-4]